MANQQQIFRSSKSRLTPSQHEYNKISDLIVAYLNTLSEPNDAEFLWLAFTKSGHKMSMSSFYGRLKKLVETGRILKIHVVNKKFIYQAIR